MADSLSSTSAYYLVLMLLLVAAIKDLAAQVTSTHIPEPNVTTEANTTIATTTTAITTTAATTTPRVQTTSMDMIAIIKQRDDLRNEADSLRAAVIVLAILASLAIIAVTIGVVWIMRRRKQTKTMQNRQDIKLATSPENKKGNTAQINTQKEPKPQAPNEKTVQGKVSTLPKTKSNQSMKAETTAPNDDSVYIEVQSSSKQPAPEQLYENTSSINLAKTYSNDSEASEMYVVIEEPKSKPGTSDKKDLSRTTAKAPPGNAATPQDDDEVYEKYDNAERTSANYSSLDAEKQYAHHYSKM